MQSLSAEQAPGSLSPTARRVRAAAWVVLLAGAILQAWSDRHGITPDGVSYLDLSDAVVDGSWRGLVNAYWSPLYPLLLGLARRALAWSPFAAPYWEFTLVHAVNLGCLVAALAAFEYFRRAIATRARRWGNDALSNAAGVAASYVLFGALTLVMISVRVPTPDLLLAALTFLAFAALTALLDAPADRRAAILLGAALGLGVLAKSFFVPLSLLVICVTIVATWRAPGARRSVVTTAATWLVFVAPWAAVLSSASGHLTLGETGRLAYAWYVNDQQPPNTGVMPPAAAPANAAALPIAGLAVTGDAPGTDPLWTDPARWNRELVARFDAAAQWQVLAKNLRYLVGVAAPLILALMVSLALVPRAAIVLTLRRGWPLLFCAVAAIGAYALVYTVARYLAPFLVVAALAIAAAFPWPARVSVVRLSAALAMVPLLLWWGATSRVSVAPVAAAAVMVACALHLAERSTWRRITAAAAAAFATGWILRQQSTGAIPLAGLAAGTIALVAMRRGAGGTRGGIDLDGTARHAGLVPDRLTTVAGEALVAATALVLLVSWISDARGDVRRLPEANLHPAARIARSIEVRGITAGSDVAVIGSPYEATWARVGRYRISAVVPQPKVEEFWKLAPGERAQVLEALGRSGARVVVASGAPTPVPAGWVALDDVHDRSLAMAPLDGATVTARAANEQEQPR